MSIISVADDRDKITGAKISLSYQIKRGDLLDIFSKTDRKISYLHDQFESQMLETCKKA